MQNEPENSTNSNERLLKQEFLRKEILDAGIDCEQFAAYLQECKPGKGGDIDSWSFRSLKGAVEEYKKQASILELPLEDDTDGGQQQRETKGSSILWNTTSVDAGSQQSWGSHQNDFVIRESDFDDSGSGEEDDDDESGSSESSGSSEETENSNLSQSGLTQQNQPKSSKIDEKQFKGSEIESEPNNPQQSNIQAEKRSRQQSAGQFSQMSSTSSEGSSELSRSSQSQMSSSADSESQITCHNLADVVDFEGAFDDDSGWGSGIKERSWVEAQRNSSSEEQSSRSQQDSTQKPSKINKNQNFARNQEMEKNEKSLTDKNAHISTKDQLTSQDQLISHPHLSSRDALKEKAAAVAAERKAKVSQDNKKNNGKIRIQEIKKKTSPSYVEAKWKSDVPKKSEKMVPAEPTNDPKSRSLNHILHLLTKTAGWSCNDKSSPSGSLNSAESEVIKMILESSLPSNFKNLAKISEISSNLRVKYSADQRTYSVLTKSPDSELELQVEAFLHSKIDKSKADSILGAIKSSSLYSGSPLKGSRPVLGVLEEEKEVSSQDGDRVVSLLELIQMGLNQVRISNSEPNDSQLSQEMNELLNLSQKNERKKSEIQEPRSHQKRLNMTQEDGKDTLSSHEGVDNASEMLENVKIGLETPSESERNMKPKTEESSIRTTSPSQNINLMHSGEDPTPQNDPTQSSGLRVNLGSEFNNIPVEDNYSMSGDDSSSRDSSSQLNLSQIMDRELRGVSTLHAASGYELIGIEPLRVPHTQGDATENHQNPPTEEMDENQGQNDAESQERAPINFPMVIDIEKLTGNKKKDKGGGDGSRKRSLASLVHDKLEELFKRNGDDSDQNRQKENPNNPNDTNTNPRRLNQAKGANSSPSEGVQPQNLENFQNDIRSGSKERYAEEGIRAGKSPQEKHFDGSKVDRKQSTEASTTIDSLEGEESLRTGNSIGGFLGGRDSLGGANINVNQSSDPSIDPSEADRAEDGELGYHEAPGPTIEDMHENVGRRGDNGGKTQSEVSGNRIDYPSEGGEGQEYAKALLADYDFGADPTKDMKTERDLDSRIQDIILNENQIKSIITNPQIIRGSMFKSNYVIYDIFTDPFQFNVSRRYSDFVWLRQILQKQFPFCYIPPLPKKSTTRLFDKYHVEKRLGQLQVFLDNVIAHQRLRSSAYLLSFLKISDKNKFKKVKSSLNNLALQVAKSNPENTGQENLIAKMKSSTRSTDLTLIKSRKAKNPKKRNLNSSAFNYPSNSPERITKPKAKSTLSSRTKLQSSYISQNKSSISAGAKKQIHNFHCLAEKLNAELSPLSSKLYQAMKKLRDDMSQASKSFKNVTEIANEIQKSHSEFNKEARFAKTLPNQVVFAIITRSFETIQKNLEEETKVLQQTLIKHAEYSREEHASINQLLKMKNSQPRKGYFENLEIQESVKINLLGGDELSGVLGLPKSAPEVKDDKTQRKFLADVLEDMMFPEDDQTVQKLKKLFGFGNGHMINEFIFYTRQQSLRFIRAMYEYCSESASNLKKRMTMLQNLKLRLYEIYTDLSRPPTKKASQAARAWKEARSRAKGFGSQFQRKRKESVVTSSKAGLKPSGQRMKYKRNRSMKG